MSYKLTILAENSTYSHNILAQHGLSILIEADNDYKLLFDVGEVEGAVEHNLQAAGVEISQINDVVISHRHIDHIGALASMMDKFENQRLFLPSQMGVEHIKDHPYKYRYMQPNPDGGYDMAIDQASIDKFMSYPKSQVVTDGFMIAENIYTTGCIGDWMEEQSIVIDQQEKGITVVLGCSHPTVEALITKAMEITGNNKVRAVIGGMHYTDYSDEEMREHSKFLQDLNLEFVLPAHCTTVRGAIILREMLGDIVKLSKNYTFATGNVVNLDSEVSFEIA